MAVTTRIVDEKKQSGKIINSSYISQGQTEIFVENTQDSEKQDEYFYLDKSTNTMKMNTTWLIR